MNRSDLISINDIRSLWLLTAAVLLLATLSAADDSVLAVPMEVPRSQGEIKIDGVLEEDAWATALVIPLRFETRPRENVSPSVETTGYITYDDQNVYVAFEAQDPDPRRIRAHLSDRDTAWNDDWVGVVLDTFNDERRAFEFFVNPLGVQMDMIQDDVSRREDAAWDAIWSSAGQCDGAQPARFVSMWPIGSATSVSAATPAISGSWKWGSGPSSIALRV